MRESIYLDNNATTFLDPLVTERMFQLCREGTANPASQHARGRHAQQLLDTSKQELLHWCGASSPGLDTAKVILTSGGTEANNLAILGATAAKPGLTIVAATDHPSVVEAARKAATSQYPMRLLPVNQAGIVDLDQLEKWLACDAQHVSLVSVMLGNNETGVLQDLPNICSLCHRYGVPVHSDVVQAMGKIPIDMRSMGLAALSLTAHKIHGPVGIGALVVDDRFAFEPMLVGGGQQFGLRPGTEPVIPAVGLTLAVRLAYQAGADGTYSYIAELRDAFESRLCDTTGATIIAGNSPRLPHTTNLSFPGIDRQALLMALDHRGIACSTGSACSSGSSRPSGVLVAMGLPSDMIAGSLRFSLSRFTTMDEILAAAEEIETVVAKLLSNKRRTS